MLDHQNRGPTAGKTRQSPLHKASAQRIELTGRLVEDEHRGPEGKDGCQRDELRLATRNSQRIPRQQIGYSDQVGRPFDPFGNLLNRQAEVSRPERDLLVDRDGSAGHLGDRVLEQDADALAEIPDREVLRRGPLLRDASVEAAADDQGSQA